jgi:hypothetical protein
MFALFPSIPWICGNKTLVAALEDLSDNITISHLGSQYSFVIENISRVDFSIILTRIQNSPKYDCKRNILSFRTNLPL